MKFVGIFFAAAISCLQGVNYDLKLADVRNSMEEMFTYHVETRDMTSVLMKRAFKNFIKQFDPQMIYFTYSEVKPFFEVSSTQIEHIIDHYFADEYPEFKALNKSINQAIHRARIWRAEFYEDFVAKGEDAASVLDEEITQYAASNKILKKRFRGRLLELFKVENKSRDPEFWTIDRRKKVCDLYEKRFTHFENKYDFDNEHFFSMHILKSMARGMDAHTAYFSPEEAYEMRTMLEKQMEGVGIAFRETLEGIEIAEIIKGGSAEKSGQVHEGDLLLTVNGTPVDEVSYRDVMQLLKGNGGKKIELGLIRNVDGEATQLTVELKRGKIILDDARVQYSTEPFGDGVIGKLILPSFYESDNAPSCEADLREALRQMKKQGKIYGLVFDMRDNLGGFLSQAVKVSSIFMKSGVVVVSKYAQGEIQYLRNIDPRLSYDGPLVILTSKMSASAAEIVAQALQDYGIGLVVGDERTHGKGTIQYQTVTDPAANAYFKVTVGRYYTVSGRSTQVDGVQTDIHVPSVYTHYPIGERFLEYALKNDQIPPAYADTLHDVHGASKLWFQKNYIPFLQKKESAWVQMLPTLIKNSKHRIKNNPNYQLFLENTEKKEIDIGMNDLQMLEAVNIVKDMISLKYEERTPSYSWH